MILIDGMPIVSSLSTVYGLSGIPNSLVEQIEIVKGPASSLYGSEAVGGLINIITKSAANAPTFSADVFTTSWLETNVDLGVKFDVGKKATALLGVNYFNYNQRIDNERAAQTLFQQNPIVKDYNTVIGQKNSLDRIVANGVGGPADVNAIFNFMKALDPNSVVRESEYDKAAASGNLFQGAFAKFNGYFKDKGGFLPDNVRQEFQNLVNQKLQAQKVAYDNIANQTRSIVARQGLNPDNVVIDFSGGIQNLGTNAAPAADQNWINTPDYENDITFAKEAIANGADPVAVKQRLLTKYKQVDL